MSIEEEIIKQKKKAEFNRSMYGISIIKENNKHYLDEADEHEQIAKWLEELVELRKRTMTIEKIAEKLNDCANRDCLGCIYYACVPRPSCKEKFIRDMAEECRKIVAMEGDDGK